MLRHGNRGRRSGAVRLDNSQPQSIPTMKKQSLGLLAAAVLAIAATAAFALDARETATAASADCGDCCQSCNDCSGCCRK